MKKIHTKKVKCIADIIDKNEQLKEHLVVDVDRIVVDKYNEILRQKLQEETKSESEEE